MIVMPSNNTGFVVGYYAGKYPTKIGLLMSPNGWRVPKFRMNYAIDNGCFKRWDRVGFFNTLKKAKQIHEPLWVCVPDAVADAETTIRRWHKYSGIIAYLGFRLSFVAQDGMTPHDVPKNAYAVFIGGSTEWKLDNAEKFKGSAPWLHIGRVNTRRRLKWAQQIGANSVDGTGFFRGDKEQMSAFTDFFKGDL